MVREIKGQIHNVSSDFKIISIQIVNKLEFFYLQPRFVKQFRKYLYSGVFVHLTVASEKHKMKRRLVSTIITFEKIIGNRYHRKFSYFDQKNVKANILDKIAKYEYRLFLDLEMTIQRSKKEYEEIIQAGAILVDKNDQVIWEYCSYIHPTNIAAISYQTLLFLNVKQQEILNGVSYKEFYQKFAEIKQKYKPAVIIWGGNDKFALDKSYLINHVTPLFLANDFIDMQAVHKEFYNLNNELGLFNTANVYKINCGEQRHNAYDDAFVTRKIFNQFYDYALKDIEFNFKNELLKLR